MEVLVAVLPLFVVLISLIPTFLGSVTLPYIDESCVLYCVICCHVMSSTLVAKDYFGWWMIGKLVQSTLKRVEPQFHNFWSCSQSLQSKFKVPIITNKLALGNVWLSTLFGTCTFPSYNGSCYWPGCPRLVSAYFATVKSQDFLIGAEGFLNADFAVYSCF